ncbi:methionine synthase [Rhodococcoides corynebacterioides]|uniref:Methionine synthase n=1 Tax=Rhodococcoides corynebacterioides TaxID=53972 RepID=A0ABS7P3B2_9NOCA|nr:methionine synthase [Rhodococcus corynebacterioides]MBY6366785.1 methionine synthase [Rhodococcus corynebacterioides]MBY6408455.1 methionine synthase [Rhodococcus corynebacterioides]
MTTPTPPVAGRATGIGSWPGTDIGEAVSTVLGELPDLPHVVELPARGLGADTVGRTGALLVDLDLDVSTTGYRLAGGRNGTARRARDLLAEDLDVLEEKWELAGLRGAGRTVKVQAAGPYTLAAEVELARGRRVLTDPGAARDVAESLAEGVAAHADEVARRLGADVVVQLDEPRLAAVLAGTLVGQTSLERVPAVPAPDVAERFTAVSSRLGRPVIVHSCAEDVPFEIFARAGVHAVAFDVSLVRPARYDALGAFLDAGGVAVLGLLPGTDPAPGAREPSWKDAARPAVELIDRLGFPRSVLTDRVAVSPACGLAGASPGWARRALTVVREVATAFAEDPAAL